MQFVELLIGTVLTVIVIIFFFTGKKYSYLLEGLDSGDFPFNGIYVVGFRLSEKGPFKLKGKIRETLVGQALILYDNRYAEYYATVVWAQMLSILFISVTLAFLLGGALNSVFFLFVCLICGGVFAYYFYTIMGNRLVSRRSDCVAELPEVVSTMALLINSGMVLREAWKLIAYSKEGEIYSLMQHACEEMHNGVMDVDAIHHFGVLSGTPEIKKFASSLIQSIERGGGDLSDFLQKQSSEMWNLKKQILLQKGESASAKLLVPTVLIFVGIIVLVIGAAIGTLL